VDAWSGGAGREARNEQPMLLMSLLRVRAFAIMLVAMSVATGCGGDDEPCFRQSQLPPPADVAALPETLLVGDQHWVLDPFLSRNFQPPGPAGGLLAVVRLTEIDSMALPSVLELDHVWVVSGDAYWSTSELETSPPTLPDFTLERTARCGPTWDTGITVDVVARVRLATVDTTYIRASDVVIERSD
jgi:hypothetical protein